MSVPSPTRASLILCLEFIRVTRDCVGGDLSRALVFAAIIDANVGHLDDNPEASKRAAALDPDYPDELRRPIRSQRIAESLGLPRQTVRNKVNQLVAMGIVEETEAGLIIPTASLVTEAFLLALEAYLSALAEHVAALAESGAAGLTPGERLIDPIWPVSGAAMRIATRHVLRAIGEVRQEIGFEGLMMEYVMIGVLRETARAHAAGQVPRITGLRLAQTLGVPRETLRRHLRALSALGRIEDRSWGVVVPEALFDTPSAQVMVERIDRDAARMVRRLRNVGAIVRA
jgi:predicted transcriptional regulator